LAEAGLSWADRQAVHKGRRRIDGLNRSAEIDLSVLDYEHQLYDPTHVYIVGQNLANLTEL
jgi:hypothetical protein